MKKFIEENQQFVSRYLSRAMQKSGVTNPGQIGVSSQDDFSRLLEEVVVQAEIVASRHAEILGHKDDDVKGVVAIAAEEVVQNRLNK